MGQGKVGRVPDPGRNTVEFHTPTNATSEIYSGMVLFTKKFENESEYRNPITAQNTQSA